MQAATQSCLETTDGEDQVRTDRRSVDPWIAGMMATFAVRAQAAEFWIKKVAVNGEVTDLIKFSHKLSEERKTRSRSEDLRRSST